jgi:subtilase family serine protease
VTVTVEATMANEGKAGARNVEVGFWNGDPDSGGTPIGSNTLAIIGAGSSAPTQIDWTEVEGGRYEVCVKVDSDDAIIESEETNNKGHKSLLVAKVKVFLSIIMRGYR